jgi:putative oxidoreductase
MSKPSEDELLGAGSRGKASWVDWLLRFIVGGAFVFAGALKIADPAKFALDVANYRLLPPELINLVAILLPWIEMVAGLFVLASIWLRASALVLTCLTVMFLVVILSALARGLNIECGCFGTIGGRHVGLVNLAIDATLFIFAALLFVRSKDCSAVHIFNEAGAQVSASPHEASSKASSAS